MQVSDDYDPSGAAARKGITANPAAKLTYDQPRVSTTSGATGIATPYAGGNASPITAPSYIAGGAPPRYNTAPQQSSVPQAPQAMAEAPAPPPAPPTGGRQWYGGLDAGSRAATDEQWLGGDADYTAQLGEYDRALNDFIQRITAQKQGFDLDAKDAISATEKNRGFSGDQLGEDFGARGMSYGGLFGKSMSDMNTRFNDQETNIGKVQQKNNNEADMRQSDYQSENNIGRGNAKRSALTRMAAQQAMLDANAGF